MSQNQRQRCRSFAARVNEVNSNPIHGGLEVFELIQQSLLLGPVKALFPVAHQVFQVVDVGARFPSGAVDLGSPTRIL